MGHIEIIMNQEDDSYVNQKIIKKENVLEYIKNILEDEKILEFLEERIYGSRKYDDYSYIAYLTKKNNFIEIYYKDCEKYINPIIKYINIKRIKDIKLYFEDLKKFKMIDSIYIEKNIKKIRNATYFSDSNNSEYNTKDYKKAFVYETYEEALKNKEEQDLIEYMKKR